MSQTQQTGQYTCECGKQFSNRNDLDKHRQTCASAQGSAGMGSDREGAIGGRTRGAGSGGSYDPGDVVDE
jgi:hypothetical protein